MAEIWRLLPVGVGPSAEHFALSDALVRVGTEPSLWWHTTREPTLILGAGQTPPGGLTEKIPVIRRQAGGTAVLAATGVLGLDVFLPAGHPLTLPDIVETYRWLGETWARGLRSLGLAVHLLSVAEARERSHHGQDDSILAACFGSVSPYEVVAGERKLVGLAQVRRRNGVLLQAGIHLSFDASGLARLLAPEQADTLAPRLEGTAMGLRELAPKVSEDDVQRAVRLALRESLGIELRPGEWTEAELRHAELAAALDSHAERC